jgi:prophage regulatory protein
MNTSTPDRFIRLPELLTIVGVSRASIWNYVKAQTFPQPVKLSPRLVGWRESEVQNWIATRGQS